MIMSCFFFVFFLHLPRTNPRVNLFRPDGEMVALELDVPGGLATLGMGWDLPSFFDEIYGEIYG